MTNSTDNTTGNNTRTSTPGEIRTRAIRLERNNEKERASRKVTFADETILIPETNNTTKDNRLKCLVPSLESLPDPAFRTIIEASATSILSSAISLRQYEERLLRQKQNPELIPNSALLKFQLTGSEYVRTRTDFLNTNVEIEGKTETSRFIPQIEDY